MRFLPALIGVVLCCVGSCTPAPAASSADRFATRLRQGKNIEAFALGRRLLCAQTRPDLGLARDVLAAWVELGRPGDPAQIVSQCQLLPVIGSYLEGMARGSSGEATAADAAFAQAAAATQEPTLLADILKRRALLALQTGDAAAALAFSQQATGHAPERADLRIVRARARLRIGELDRVVPELLAILVLNPAASHLQQAREVIGELARRSEEPLPEGVAQSVSKTLGELERPELEREMLLQTIALSATYEHPRVLTVAGMAALRIGATDEARRLLELAGRLNPYDPVALRTLGSALFLTKRQRESLAPLMQAVKRDPFHVETQTQLAEAAMHAKDWQTARDSYRHLVVLEPKNARFFLRLARLEGELGEVDRAAAAAERSFRLDGANSDVLLARAVAQAALLRQSEVAETQALARTRVTESLDLLEELAPSHPSLGALRSMLERVDSQ